MHDKQADQGDPGQIFVLDDEEPGAVTNPLVHRLNPGSRACAMPPGCS